MIQELNREFSVTVCSFLLGPSHDSVFAVNQFGHDAKLPHVPVFVLIFHDHDVSDIRMARLLSSSLTMLFLQAPQILTSSTIPHDFTLDKIFGSFP